MNGYQYIFPFKNEFNVWHWRWIYQFAYSKENCKSSNKLSTHCSINLLFSYRWKNWKIIFCGDLGTLFMSDNHFRALLFSFFFPYESAFLPAAVVFGEVVDNEQSFRKIVFIQDLINEWFVAIKLNFVIVGNKRNSGYKVI